MPDNAATSATKARSGLAIERRFTQAGVHPYDEVEWELRDALIGDPDRPAFLQRDVEVPKTWSQNATNIVAQKYFRGGLDSPDRERSVKQMLDRVAGTIAEWGRVGGYFASAEDADAFEAELTSILLGQVAAFNSPVWFNVGWRENPQCSACFILSVEDTMESILHWNTQEGIIFKGGSGSGINLSKIRGSMEPLEKGGIASGPVSFMRGADSWAGAIKSGGGTRRAAKMVILNADHPDIEEFIWCKALEEDKALALREAGFDMSIDGSGFSSVQFQNANNSVRVTDEFMRAVENDDDWDLLARTDGSVVKTVKARDLMNQIAEAAWRCADPGFQYDTTINEWHTNPNTGPITGSNPCCFTGDTLVQTSSGPVRFDDLYEAHVLGQELPNVNSCNANGDLASAPVSRVWVAGMTERLVEVRTANGLLLRCTPEHRFLLGDGRYVEAQHLNSGVCLKAMVEAPVPVSPAGLTDLTPDVTPLPSQDSIISVEEISLLAPVPVYDLEVPTFSNFTVTSEIAADHGVVVHNSEYMSIDDSACNLASLNLMKFRREDGSFEVEDFKHAVDIVFLAQEILVGFSSYPTEKITQNARDFRQLGLGYANLGALLMSNGLPYDSDEGRNVAAAITSLMTGRAYKRSAEIAEVQGAYEGYAVNRDPHNKVMRMHRDASYEIDGEGVRDDLLDAARKEWEVAVELGDEHGYRNAQASVLAPTGTISFLMDCDTTGIEPDFSLVKHKELVGGGNMTIVNQSVGLALETLGYSQSGVDQVVAYIDEQNTIIGAPGLKDEHLPVFDVAVGERAISHTGHIDMMAATQPFISGAISKTVNLPESATVGDIADAYTRGWTGGLKALAIYRDGSKTAQALRTDAQKEKSEPATAETDTLEPGAPIRRRMPQERESLTHKFSIAGHEGYITAGKYEDGTVGEIFLTDIGKEGSTLRGMLNAFATAISLGLQYGVPLEVFVRKFSYMRFDPEGITQNPEIPFAKSMPDYIMRWLASRFINDLDELEDLGIMTSEVRAKKEADISQLGLGIDDGGGSAKPTNGNGSDTTAASGKPVAPTRVLTDTPPVRPARLSGPELGPACDQCGGMMQRTGACYTCSSCGNNTGCG